MTSKAEEIAKRLVVELAVSARNEPGGYVPVIKAALHEYGALVRARDAAALNDPKLELMLELSGNPIILAASDEQAIRDALGKIADAIDREPLP